MLPSISLLLSDTSRKPQWRVARFPLPDTACVNASASAVTSGVQLGYVIVATANVRRHPRRLHAFAYRYGNAINAFAHRVATSRHPTPCDITMRQELSLIHISEPTRRTPTSYAVFCLK